MSFSEGDQHLVKQRTSFKRSLPISFVAAGITAFLLVFLIGGKGRTTEALIAGIIFATMGGLFTFSILRTGRVNTSRLILFIGMGLFFGIAFTLDHQINRGSILLTNSHIKSGNVPICPMLLPLGYLGRWESIHQIALMATLISGVFFFLMDITQLVSL